MNLVPIFLASGRVPWVAMKELPAMTSISLCARSGGKPHAGALTFHCLKIGDVKLIVPPSPLPKMSGKSWAGLAPSQVDLTAYVELSIAYGFRRPKDSDIVLKYAEMLGTSIDFDKAFTVIKP